MRNGVVRPRVKICCISSVAEAELAIRFGASALGLVSSMPSGPGVIPFRVIAEIAAWTPPPIATFLLTSSRDAREIADQVKICGTSTVQICDRLEGSCKELRALIPGVKIVQVVHVNGSGAVREASAAEPDVDAILLDSGNQELEIAELGGTGRTHDWSISKEIVGCLEKPVFLAGGLSSSNVHRAVEEVRPFGLDLCSGVRTGGSLDGSKLSEFFASI